MDQIAALINDIRFSLLLIALLFFNFSQITSAFRFRTYLTVIDIKLPLWDTTKLYYLGMFYNLFLPGGIGGDGYKIWILKKEFSKSWKSLVLISFLERLNGVAALITLAIAIFSFIPAVKIWGTPPFAYLLLAIIIFPGLYLLMRIMLKKYTQYFITITLQSLLIQALQLICAYFILVALGLESNFMSYLFLFLISSVAAVIPVTVGGIGAREMVFIYGSTFLPVDTNLAVGFSLVFFLITATSSFSGIFFDTSKETMVTSRQS
ncbi:lysylphosphatidylglycerol synthase transmembrane domain-containing protein [Fulvivirgaceae bacterium BMA12]|uniref:Lysylphosphatidylglycerol synthase transmembrane domain-containing protein n=1 Tax=Agaribacillus aureus TaxID=3051825 RepID=A0ABT8L490_9BACT|nr:lysylphosphatidylglycerol synthase transmembrane domain-containing protein [Fulvivirgaceae bacterium BMA12]